MTRYPYFIVILLAIAICSTSTGYTNPGDGFPLTPNIPELRMQQTLSGSMSAIESFKNIGTYEKCVARVVTILTLGINVHELLFNSIYDLSDRPKLIRQMLSALDTGHDQFINSIWPQQLKYLIEYYDQKNAVNGKGKRSISLYQCPSKTVCFFT